MCIHTLPGNQSGIFLHLHDVLVSKDSGKKKKLHIDCLTLRLLVWGYMFHHFSGPPTLLGKPPKLENF